MSIKIGDIVNLHSDERDIRFRIRQDMPTNMNTDPWTMNFKTPIAITVIGKETGDIFEVKVGNNVTLYEVINYYTPLSRYEDKFGDEIEIDGVVYVNAEEKNNRDKEREKNREEMREKQRLESEESQRLRLVEQKETEKIMDEWSPRVSSLTNKKYYINGNVNYPGSVKFIDGWGEAWTPVEESRYSGWDICVVCGRHFPVEDFTLGISFKVSYEWQGKVDSRDSASVCSKVCAEVLEETLREANSKCDEAGKISEKKRAEVISELGDLYWIMVDKLIDRGVYQIPSCVTWGDAANIFGKKRKDFPDMYAGYFDSPWLVPAEGIQEHIEDYEPEEEDENDENDEEDDEVVESHRRHHRIQKKKKKTIETKGSHKIRKMVVGW